MKKKQYWIAAILIFSLFLCHCSEQKQVPPPEDVKTAPLLVPKTSSTIDLSKLPSLPTTLPTTLPATQATSLPSLPESQALSPESKAESLPESNLAQPSSSTSLSIYERLKNAPHTW